MRRVRSGPTTCWPTLSASKARTRCVELLRESGDLVGEPRPITHQVKFYEKGRQAAGDHHQPPVVHQDDGAPG